MKKIICIMVVTLFALSASYSLAASSKFSANVKDMTIIDWTTEETEWSTVLESSIKTPNKKDLLIGVSFETGVYTQTLVKSKDGVEDSSQAGIELLVRCVIDDDISLPYAPHPSEVVYDHRIQYLSAILQGLLVKCEDSNGDGVITSDECEWTEEEINLWVETMAAHHFNFVAADLVPGEHTIKVQVKINPLTTESNLGSAEAKALIGRGSLTVEEVKAINQDGGIVFE